MTHRDGYADKQFGKSFKVLINEKLITGVTSENFKKNCTPPCLLRTQSLLFGGLVIPKVSIYTGMFTYVYKYLCMHTDI